MTENNLIGYVPKKTIIHQLSGFTKLFCFLLLSIIGMVSYDTRFLLCLAVFSVLIFRIARISYSEISFVLKFIAFFSILNLLTVYLFAPEYGVAIYGTRHVIFDGIGRYTLTQEQIFYEFNLLIKYFVTIPPGLIFILTTNPSELASSIHRIGGSYKIAYAFSLALRYIPDIQEDFRTISKAQQARGNELSGKASLMKRVRGNLTIAIPLIFSSLERIETISSAMELRRFGKKKGRTWLSAKPLQRNDYLALFLVVLFCSIGILLVILNDGRFYNPFH
ncbi:MULTISPECIES: energy-coupling factor transporter transmembrane component T family protein [Enterococcus]|jgi:energy-coupling factor transport system permease protein|uniref:Energy-coupling factor transporter transmembrane protein EcfT n=2 Tax=Enterococcus faecium TaxID=1352 RepID=A0A242BL74_ENTFC|nr:MULTISPECIES: energy-coupling factor transporter transmembrane component T [Enterococcus]AYM73352.1 energy-coupling factor transporter transmembrane protein EcfT [Enterococcus faecium]EJY46745.1 cobalt transport protein [Enterococcus faecium 505]EME7218945.1 energy-coupling factor transporter transmembrane protein EcfT [Enterococcus faecium]EME8111872.1 energy-coupling factor transporter transmembrane protein EcfT [Enterococcus faecium]EME8123470.1 energy-coupling factor transporter transme